MTRRKQYMPCFWLILAGTVGLLLLSVGVVFAFKILGQQFSATYKTYSEADMPASEPSIQELSLSSLPLHPLWDQEAPMPIDRTPRIVDDVVLLEGDKTLVGLDPTSGSIIWSFQAPGSIDDYTSRSVVVEGHYVAFRVLPGGTLYLLDISTGNLAWKTNTPVKEFDAGEDEIFIKIVDARYEARDLEEGTILWTFEPTEHSKRSGIKYHNQQLFVWEGNEHYVLDPQTGSVEQYYEGEPYSSDIASLSYDGVFFALKSSPNLLVAVSIDGRYMMWEYGISNPLQNPYIQDERIYFSDSEGNLVAVDVETGNLLWHFAPLATAEGQKIKLLSNPVELHGIVYGIFSDATLRGVNKESGVEIGYIQFPSVSQLRWQVTMPGLAASDNMLIVSPGYRKIYAFDSN
jgi:outer membrane protein assembly factor BamB